MTELNECLHGKILYGRKCLNCERLKIKSELIESQETLPTEFKKVYFDNKWELYENE